MKKTLSLILSALLLAALLAGCGGASGDASAGAAQEITVVGSWSAEIDMTQFINDSMGQDSEMAQFLTLENIKVRYNAEFKEDGTYAMSGDLASAQAVIESVKEQMKPALYSYFEYMIKQEGMDMTVDELLKSSGMTMDELVDSMDEALTPESLISGMEMAGNYLYEDGKLAMSSSPEEKADMKDYESVTLTADTLTFTGENMDVSGFAGLYPIVFQRQS
jgi:predicted small secreted protein